MAQGTKAAKKPVLSSGSVKQTKKPAPVPASKPAPPIVVLGPDGKKLEPYAEPLPKSTAKIQMVPVPGGKITINGKEVEIKPFYMAKTETAWEQYDPFYESGTPTPAYDQTDWPEDAIARPSKSYILPDLGWGHKGFPAINVSYLSVTMYCRWLSKETGKKYRLPTEAEWEWACRAGVTGEWKMTPAELDKIAWHRENSDKMSHPVGTKRPNRFGLHDMLGNPGEWAVDLEGKPVLCGGTFMEVPARQLPGYRQRWSPKWQETDPQFPKSRWWLADGKFCGFRVVCEP